MVVENLFVACDTIQTVRGRSLLKDKTHTVKEKNRQVEENQL